MTIVKTLGVQTAAHMASLKKYLTDDRALAHGSQNLLHENERAFKEMEQTRQAWGHTEPAKANCANTVALHQIIAFKAEEADFNGGKMTVEKCMEFTRDWLSTRYPYQEAFFSLHKEYCRADNTNRYAVHICINRTMLDGSGRRLDEGFGRAAAYSRAQAMREMDKRWGLEQVRANERNSIIHARQPTRAEREMEKRGIRTDKKYLRQAIKASIKEVKQYPSINKVRELSKALESKGVKMTLSKNGKDFTFERESTSRKVNGVKLGRGFSKAGIEKGLSAGIEKSLERSKDEGMSR